jgi:allantoicase
MTQAPFTELMDLASLRLRGAVIAASDDFFAEKENLLKPADAVFLPHEYTDRGKWMDGWESRRKRVPGHDQAIVRLGVPGVLRGVVVDTAFFRGNFPSHCSIEACAARSDARIEELTDPSMEWIEVLPKSPLNGDSKNLFSIEVPHAFSHVRLNIFPDGGVARLRVFGEAVPDWRRTGHARGEVDLAAAENGAHVVTCSDMFFGERRNLIMPDRALNMGDGWETRRSRGPHHDWALVKLAARGALSRIVIDTHHFKGNYPDTCRVMVCDATGEGGEARLADEHAWRELLPRTKLQADTRHWFEDELLPAGEATHLRLEVFPDGGVSRLRAFGTLSAEARQGLGLRRFNTLTPAAAEAALRACCGSSRWIEWMREGQPYATVADLLATADATWSWTSSDDWHEAFRAHPRIGEKKAAAGQDATAKAWSSAEQSGTQGATDAMRAELAEINRAYEARFGFIYIVCATGRSLDEMLTLARARMKNDPAAELRVAAAEQHRITRLRLEKLLEP